MNILWGNSLWQLIRQSDAVTCLVLLILLGMSILCWTVLVYKIILLVVKRKQMNQMIKTIKTVSTFQELLQVSRSFTKTLPGNVLAQHLSVLKDLLKDGEESKQQLSKSDWDLLLDRGYQIVSDVLYNEETYLPILSTTAAAAPLLGLFGTVWGLVHSFIRISEQQAADISVVAPGIAEALMTTLAGLVVAIPALIMFNYLMSQVRLMEQQLAIVSDKINWVVRKIFVK
ncbi:hypothetical protein HN446_01415 [bacterium]|jgi:biopolymer transport protein TolQ|nr:hypothetical protein [bacterium]